jgi:hypothetical protein
MTKRSIYAVCLGIGVVFETLLFGRKSYETQNKTHNASARETEHKKPALPPHGANALAYLMALD